MSFLRALTGTLACIVVLPARAHAPTDAAASIPALAWQFEPWIVGCMMASITLYLVGLRSLWKKAGIGRGIAQGQACCFMLGWLCLVGALMSPLDELGALLFSAHMVQHELMMIVAAPLLVMGRPLAVWAWALPPDARRATGRAMRWPPLAATWRALTMPLAAWALHGLILWAWHLPDFFEAAVASAAVHTLQHTSFLGSALLFWWAPLGRDATNQRGGSMLYLFTTMAHTAALGALLTLSPTPWYPSYVGRTALLGFDPLEDQQLGGLIMWVPGGLAYLIAGLAVAARMLRGAPATADA